MGRAAGTHPGVVPVDTSHGRRPPVRLAHEVPWSFPAPVALQASRCLAIGTLALFPNHWVITRPWETTNPWAAGDPCSILGAQLPVLRSNLSPWWKWQDEPRTEAPTSAWRAQQGAPGSAEDPGERVGGAPPLTAAQGRHPTHQRPPQQLPGDVQGLRRIKSMVSLLAKPATFPFFSHISAASLGFRLSYFFSLQSGIESLVHVFFILSCV